MRMNTPAKKSRTSDWAPKPTAKPAIPAPAIRGAKSMFSSLKHNRTATAKMSAVARLFITAAMVCDPLGAALLALVDHVDGLGRSSAEVEQAG